jgi:Reverse transcriptase (RNA-dependent DNA polymerase)
MTPLFLKLAKGCKSGAKLSDITLPDFTLFRSDEERDEYIVNFFENIYKVPENAPPIFDGVIENFLGPNIASHPVVLNSKLTVAEAEFLNYPISLQELDNSVEKAKINTAGGPDGFNNFFIKRFWHLFRNKLFNYANTCFRKGIVTDSFRTANVHLIPKKGDTRLLKNWRPISLLSCFYKVISRAVNERLKKISDIIFSRAQKGFTSSRYIHEVLINLSENIAYCNSSGTTGAIISIDQANAFDTIYHGFVRESYKFFGVGENFLNIMDTLGTNRNACILLDNGAQSHPFNLGTGRPQGDCVSPQQILVTKYCCLGLNWIRWLPLCTFTYSCLVTNFLFLYRTSLGSIGVKRRVKLTKQMALQMIHLLVLSLIYIHSVRLSLSWMTLL